MQAYTKRLFMGVETVRSTSAAVPSGVIWVVRCVDSAPGVDTAITVNWGIAPGIWVWSAHLDNASGARHAQWQGRQVLEAGEAIDVYASGLATFIITGYELGA